MADEFAWEKPAWTKGAGLKKTGRRTDGNLAAPITDLPQQAQAFSKPGWTGEAAEKPKPETNLAKPITSIRETGDEKLAFEKPEWAKKKVLKESDKGSTLKSGGEIARPIGGIKLQEDWSRVSRRENLECHNSFYENSCSE